MFRCCWSAWVECVSPEVWVEFWQLLDRLHCVLLAVSGFTGWQHCRGDHHLAVSHQFTPPPILPFALISSSMPSSSVPCNCTLKWWLPCFHHKDEKLSKHAKCPHHHWGCERHILNWTSLGMLAVGKTQNEFLKGLTGRWLHHLLSH